MNFQNFKPDNPATEIQILIDGVSISGKPVKKDDKFIVHRGVAEDLVTQKKAKILGTPKK